VKNLYNALQLRELYKLKALGYKYTNIKPFSFEDSSLELANTLVELKQQVNNCHLCSLSKTRDKVVFGEGYNNAQIMFIGDYPMDIENSVGQPFLGHSGEMLTLMIEKVLGIPRRDVYITNIIKCQLPSNQKLHDSYIHSCKSYLFKEIELIQPNIIITLGQLSYHYLTNDNSQLKDIHGNIIQKESYKIIPSISSKFFIEKPLIQKRGFYGFKKGQINSLML